MRAKELEIKNAYNNINILDDKLKNNLKLAEYKKIINNIDQLKKVYQKKNQNYMSLKKVQKKELEPIKQNLLKIKINNLRAKH